MRVLLIKLVGNILLILTFIFIVIFTIIGIGITIIKNTINDMIEFKGDKKNEKSSKIWKSKLWAI